MSYAAIPTFYGGVQFRSRLEARYACFFDLLGWVWDYEPIDLNGYIPDFILRFERPLLVEVKSALHPEQHRPPNLTFRSCPGLVGTWIVGATIGLGPDADTGTLFASGGWGWRPAQLEFVSAAETHPDRCTNKGDHWSPHSVEGRWGCLVHEDCGTKIYGSLWRHPDKQTDLKRMWLEAGNRVQWKAPISDEQRAAGIRLSKKLVK